MRYYPLLLDLHALRCLVVGAGEVGLRKIQGLLPCGPAHVTVIDPAPASQGLRELLARHANISYKQRPFVEDDILGMRLAFACTSRREVNDLVAQVCARRSVLCNVTDCPDQGDFVLPASITRGDLTISVSTSGSSPALARVIRQQLESRYGPEYEALTRLMAAIRVSLLALGWSSDDNRRIFRGLAASALPELIKKNDRDRCRELLFALLPDALHPRIGEWCDDCFQTV